MYFFTFFPYCIFSSSYSLGETLLFLFFALLSSHFFSIWRHRADSRLISSALRPSSLANYFHYLTNIFLTHCLASIFAKLRFNFFKCVTRILYMPLTMLVRMCARMSRWIDTIEHRIWYHAGTSCQLYVKHCLPLAVINQVFFDARMRQFFTVGWTCCCNTSEDQFY